MSKIPLIFAFYSFESIKLCGVNLWPEVCAKHVLWEMIEAPVTLMLYSLLKVLSITFMLKCDFVSS